MNIERFFNKFIHNEDVSVKRIWSAFLIIFLFVVIFIFFYVFGHQSSVKEIYKEQFISFYYSDIKGEVEWAKTGRPVKLKIKGVDTIYYFYSDFGINSKYPFASVAHTGDSVIKPANCDTIRIIKSSGESFYFLFNTRWKDL